MSAFTTLNNLVSDFRLKARVQASEGFTDPDDFRAVIIGAASKHNSSYVVSASVCTIPAREQEAVVTLSLIDFTFIRLSALSLQPGITSQGFGSDRNTPFQKLKDYLKLLVDRYDDIVAALGIPTYYGAGTVTQSEVTVENLSLGAQTSIGLSLTPPEFNLYSTPSDHANSDGTVTLFWDNAPFDNFLCYFLYTVTGATPIFQPWNYDSIAGTPRILDTATKLFQYNRIDQQSALLTNLVVTSGTVNRFVLVIASKSGKYSYSDELVLTQP